jgi:hypothetical protein
MSLLPRVGWMNPGHVNIVFLESDFKNAISDYGSEHIEEIRDFPPSEVIDITDRVNLGAQYRRAPKKYLHTGALSILLKDRVCYLRYDVTAWVYCERGVSSIGGWILYDRTMEIDSQKRLHRVGKYLNSPDVNAPPYDGTSNFFFVQICDFR